MGRNASLLLILFVIVGGIFYWLLAEPGVQADGPVGTEVAAETLGPEPADPTVPGAGADAAEEEAGDRQAIAVEGLGAGPDPLARLVALDQARLTGRLVDPDGQPIPGHDLTMLATDNLMADPGLALAAGAVVAELEATTDGDGRFSFSSVGIAGRWLHLVAEHATWPTLSLGPFTPVPGRETDLGDLRFGRGERVAVRVTDEDGLGVGGAELLLARLPFGILGSGGPLIVAEPVTTTAGDGTARLEGMAPGRYTVGARSPRHAIAWSDEIEVDDQVPPAEMVLTLEPGHELLGRVVDGESGLGVAGAEVLIQDRTGGAAAYERYRTDGSGGFRRPGTGENRRLRYRVDAEGYQPSWGNLREPSVTAGQLEQTIEVVALGEVEVIVLDDESGAPLEDARLFLLATDRTRLSTAERLGIELEGGAPDLARTDASGLAVVQTPAGDEYLYAGMDGYLARAVELQRGEAPAAPIEVRLERGGGILARVSGPDGPVAGAVVELCLVSTDATEGEGGGGGRRDNAFRNRRWREPTVSAADLVWSDLARLQPVARRASDEAGTAHFLPVPKGFFRLVASGPGLGRTVSEPLRMRDGEEDLEVDIALLPAGRIEGRVLLRGLPEPDQRVVAMRELRAADRSTMPAEAEVHATRSDEDGRFALDGLGPGTWRVFALRPGEVAGSAANGNRAVTRQLEDKAELVELAAGDQRAVDLEAQSPGAVLTGVVRLNHRPHGGLRILARYQDPEGGRGSSLVTRTDTAGRYRLEGLLEGDWELEVSTEAIRTGSLYVDRITLVRELVSVGDVEELERDVSAQAGAMTVLVKKPEEDEEPPTPGRRARRGNWVSMQLDADLERGGVVGLTGRTLVRGWMPMGRDSELPILPVGAYRIKITEDASEPVSEPIDIDAGLGTRLEVTLTPLQEEEEGEG